MPKRKANQSIDEWLREGEAAIDASRTSAEAAREGETIQAVPTAESVHTGGTLEPRAEAVATVATIDDVTLAKDDVALEDVDLPKDVVAIEDAATSWSWDLLAQSGYERW